MAKNKADENQLDLFSIDTAKVDLSKIEKPAVDSIEPVSLSNRGINSGFIPKLPTANLGKILGNTQTKNLDEPVAMVDGGISDKFPTAIFDKVIEKPAPVAMVDGGISNKFPTAVFDKPASVSEDIQSFLKTKEETVEAVDNKKFVEIAGQVKMDAIAFAHNMPTENRFVSLSQHSDMVIITPIPEDGSLTLKTMKENYPTFVTQVQKVTEDFIPDALSNLEFLDKIRTIVEGKIKASKHFDSKEVEAEMAFISKIDQGDVDFDEEPTVEAAVEPTVEKPTAKKLKM